VLDRFKYTIVFSLRVFDQSSSFGFHSLFSSFCLRRVSVVDGLSTAHEKSEKSKEMISCAASKSRRES